MSDIVERIEALKTEASTCRLCGLCENRQNVVFGEGNPETPLVIVGEGPCANEDATGRPFVGRAGQLLDAALLENGITRKHVYICNTVKCRPTSIENGSVRNRPPSPDEMATCLPWLTKQLEIIKPRVILCLGAPSANTIIHTDFRITKERGQFFDTPYAEKAIAAFHPSYVLRLESQTDKSARASLVADINAARLKVIELKKERASQ